MLKAIQLNLFYGLNAIIESLEPKKSFYLIPFFTYKSDINYCFSSSFGNILFFSFYKNESI